MSDRQALLAAIVAQPTEDLPRLVFADYLEETDNPEDAKRAAFIRKAYPLPQDRRAKESQFCRDYATNLLAGLIPPSWRIALMPTPGSPEWPHADGMQQSWAHIANTSVRESERSYFTVCLKHGFIAGVSTSERRFFKSAASVFRSQPIEWASIRAVPSFQNFTRQSESRCLWGRRAGKRSDLRTWTLRPELYDLLSSDDESNAYDPGWIIDVPHRFYVSHRTAMDDLERACVLLGRNLARMRLIRNLSL